MTHLPWWEVSPGVIRGYEESGKTRWSNETTTSPSPPTRAKEPTLRNSWALSLPPTRLPQPPAQRPVFEDACRGGLRSGHRITVWVTGLDTSVRCYPLTHILTGAVWYGQVSGTHRSAAHWCVQAKDKESFRYGGALGVHVSHRKQLKYQNQEIVESKRHLKSKWTHFLKK